MSKKNRLLIAVFGIVVAGIIIVITGQNVSTQTREYPEDPGFEDPTLIPTPQEQTGGMDVYNEINQKALVAQNGQAQAIGELVDAVFVIPGVVASESSLTSALKDRIVRAEINKTTITEQQLTNTVNWLADELSAPQYAKTSSVQTRVLRLDSNILMPNLFPEKTTEESLSSTPTTMSACEAICLLSDILFQKAFNPRFQKNPSEWEAEFNNLMQSGEQTTQESTTTLVIETNVKRELLEIISGKSQTEIENLAHTTLDRLGIQR